MRRAAVLVVVVLAATALAGCGVPVDQSPTVLPRQGVPFGLLDQSPASTTTTTPGNSPVEVTVQIFLLSPNGHLVAVTRDVPFPAPLTAVLGALVDGPTDAEAANALQGAVPAQTTVVSATVSNGVATIDLGGTFAQLVGQNEIDAVAQVVFTATALAGVTQVAFELDGQAVAVPTAGGADVAVANRSQFASMAPS